jgi:hypothetical protein
VLAVIGSRDHRRARRREGMQAGSFLGCTGADPQYKCQIDDYILPNTDLKIGYLFLKNHKKYIK